MVTLKAVRNFNNGKGVVKKIGDKLTVSESEAKTLIDYGYAKKVDISHKKMEIK